RMILRLRIPASLAKSVRPSRAPNAILSSNTAIGCGALLTTCELRQPTLSGLRRLSLRLKRGLRHAPPSFCALAIMLLCLGGCASTVLVTVSVSIRLDDSTTGNVLYRNDNVVFREPYEISTDVSSFFEEEGPALDRMARDFAARVVAGLLENF